MFFKNTIISLFLISLPVLIFSQSGSIKGVVTEVGSNESIPVANVIILGTSTGTITDFDGNFELSNLEPGKYDIQVSFISFKTCTIQDIEVNSNKATEIKVELEVESQILAEVEITAEMKRDNENLLLLDRQNATQITQQIGAQELSRKGASDVADAVAKVSGISKSDRGGDIYVRGLGDRYNSTTLNKLPIPSNNPETKNIALDLFSTDIVEYISIDKVYNNLFYGDFAGGNVDIVSKDFNGDSYLKIEIGSNLNTSSLGSDEFTIKDGPGFIGFSTSDIPVSISDYSFSNSLKAKTVTPVGINFSLMGGGKYILGSEKDLNYFVSLNFDNDYSFKEGISKSVNSSGYASKDLKLQDYSYNSNTTGMLNLGYRINRNNKINYNFLFINSSENSSEIYSGTILDIADNNNGLLIRRTYEKNTVIINQLLGKHKISSGTEFKWGVGYNKVNSQVPDRIQNTFRMLDNGDYVIGQNQITDNNRYYHFLSDDEVAINLSLEKKFFSKTNDNFNADDYKLKLDFGYTARFKKRDFESTQFNFRVHSDQSNTAVDPYDMDLFFNQANLLQENYFRIETFRGNSQVPNVLNPQVYGGSQIINALFVNAEYKLSSKFIALVGIRGEYVFQEVNWNTQLDPTNRSDVLTKIGVLPSITAKYLINSKQNLRIGASKTYTLPQFKERALFIYEDVTQVKLGNPDLYASDNYNLDVKWELFPDVGEIVSLGAFGKYILNPINEVTISSATNDISFINTGNRGFVAGIEFEARKEIVSSYKNKLLVGFNASYMKTNQDLNSEKVEEETKYAVRFTHDKARFTGASDLLINADITYMHIWKEKNKLSATFSYNYFSDRIYAIGTNSRGDIIEKAFNTVDLILKSEFDKLSIGLNLRNILNPNIETYQANQENDITILSYKRGVNFSLKIAYTF